MFGLQRTRGEIVASEEYAAPTVAELSALAMKTMTAWFVPNARKPLFIRVEGKCPGCTHQTKWKSPLAIYVMDTGFSWFRRPGQFLMHEGLGKIVMTPTATEFSMKCACGKSVDGHQDGSCGAMWNMRVAKAQ